MKRSNRFQLLKDQIHSYFDVRDPFIVPRLEPQVDEHVMDMFEVIEIHGTTLKLGHYFCDKTYQVTVGEMEIAKLIRPGDVFLMAIIRRNKSWRVWHMSPPYD